MNTDHTSQTGAPPEPPRLCACRYLGLRLWPWLARSGVIETCVLLAPGLPDSLIRFWNALGAGALGHG